MHLFRFVLVLAIALSGSLFQLRAQTLHKLSGSVVDTTGKAISEANIQLISGTDTLRTTSNKDGAFNFRDIKSSKITLGISIIGYQRYSALYELKEKTTSLAPVALKNAGEMLKEVVIRPQPQPIRIKKDTIEYDASAYNVMENDRVSELLKQLPGMEVDDDDNVKTMGKEMTKLRVNGKDFFTNNVKDFISKLPASIVAKIQVIDDYGDQANFTGIKVGEPIKMLNIVTKPGMDKGVFGTFGTVGGTNDQYGAKANGNLWRDQTQIGFNGGFNNANNGAGRSKNINANGSYLDKIGKTINSNLNYSFGNSQSDNQRESLIETTNTLGTIFNQTGSNGNNKSNNHNLALGLQSSTKKRFFIFNLGLSQNKGTSSSESFSRQSGIVKQDLNDENRSTSHTPNINVGGSWSQRFQQSRNNLSFNFNFSRGVTTGGQQINSHTTYYDPSSSALVKDSILNRLIDTENSNNNLMGGLTFSQVLGKKDTVASRSLNLSYNFSIANNENSLLTYVTDAQGIPHYVDTLSNRYHATNMVQNTGVSYSYIAKKLSYSLGVNVQPSLMRGKYEDRDERISNSTFNYSPTFNISYRKSPSNSFSAYYNGGSRAPSFYQLQPVRNTQNLQNVVIGNPDLKPAFSHTINMSYNLVGLKTGKSLQLGVGASTVQNQIVTNVVLRRDTLNSLKQETRYENTNGTYNMNGNYALTLPLGNRKYNVSLRGNVGYAQNVSFTDNVKLYNRGINLSQSLNSGYNNKKFSANGSVSYSLNTNNYSIQQQNIRNIESWFFNLTARANLFKGFNIGLNGSKRINSGYALSNNNPLIINANVSQTFFKKKSATLTIQGYDLLKQGNNLSRYVSGNSIVDSRSNQLTRYFTFSLSFNMEQFGRN